MTDSEQSDCGALCSADAESLRAAQCDDAEIKAHLFMHDKGLCPVPPASSRATREEYIHMVHVFRGCRS